MSYILDIVLVLILAVCVLLGVKRGCAKMLVRVGGTLLAVVIAASLSGQVAGFVFDTWLSDGIKAAVAENLPELNTGNLSVVLDEALDELPPFVLEFAEQQEVDMEAFAEDLLNQVDGNTASLRETVAVSVTEQVVRPVAVALLTVLCFLILLVVLLVVVHLLAGIVDKIFKLPLLGTLNKTLGGVLGAVQGVLWIAVVLAAIQLIAYSGGDEALINAEFLEGTVLTKYLVEINPLSTAISEVSVQANNLLN